MKKYVDKFHFIINEQPNFSAVSQAQKACEAGGKWIQYRCLHKSDESLLEDIHQIAQVCDDWGTTLIVTNHIHLAGKADIQGFHLEDPEVDIKVIRAQLGDSYTIGVSAMDIDRLVKMAQAGADYIGLGPFAKTVTKPNNYPLITRETYVEAVNKLIMEGLDTPIIAVGGITVEDLDLLNTTGIHGIAASAALVHATDFDEAYSAFLR